ncbi:hypothetical protein ACWCOV_04490 [Kribbella sp. NPDC002412]
MHHVMSVVSAAVARRRPSSWCATALARAGSTASWLDRELARPRVGGDHEAVEARGSAQLRAAARKELRVGGQRA